MLFFLVRLGSPVLFFKQHHFQAQAHGHRRLRLARDERKCGGERVSAAMDELQGKDPLPIRSHQHLRGPMTRSGAMGLSLSSLVCVSFSLYRG